MYPTTRLTKPHWMTYGLGWFQQDYRGRAVDFHTGSIDGMVAIHGLIRDERLGVYVLGNLDHAELRHALMYTVFDRYAGDGSRLERGAPEALWRAAERSGQDPRGERGASACRARRRRCRSKQLAGDYVDPLHGDVHVTDEGGGLRLQYGAAFVGTLEHWHYNTFRATWKAAWRAPELVTFVVDEDGSPSAVELMGARFGRKP